MDYSVLIPYKFRFLNDTNKEILNDINYNYESNINNRNFFKKQVDKLFAKINKSYTPYIRIQDINKMKSLNTLLSAIRCNILLDNDINKRDISVCYRKNLRYNTEMSVEIVINTTDKDIEIRYEIFNICDATLIDYDTFVLKPSEYVLFKPHTNISCKSDEDLLIFSISPKYINHGLIQVPEYDSVFLRKK
jgi:hypothetical protein